MQVAFTRVDAVGQLDAPRGDAVAAPRLVLAEFLATTTTVAPPKPKAKAQPRRTTTTRRTSTTKPKAGSGSAKGKTTATTARAAAKPPPNAGPASRTGNSQTGKASWYNAPDGTCAHRTLAKGLIITVTNLANSKQITCRVSDRGPYIDGRIIDLSRSGFEALGQPAAGVINVRLDW